MSVRAYANRDDMEIIALADPTAQNRGVSCQLSGIQNERPRGKLCAALDMAADPFGTQGRRVHIDWQADGARLQ